VTFKVDRPPARSRSNFLHWRRTKQVSTQAGRRAPVLWIVEADIEVAPILAYHIITRSVGSSKPVSDDAIVRLRSVAAKRRQLGRASALIESAIDRVDVDRMILRRARVAEVTRIRRALRARGVTQYRPPFASWNTRSMTCVLQSAQSVAGRRRRPSVQRHWPPGSPSTR
jgi:hypothetical protein